MARKRMIDPGIWRNKRVLRVSRDARILFLGMVTLADDYGYGDADPMALRVSIFPGDSDVTDTDLERMCAELVTVQLVEIADGLYRLPGWENHQKLRADYVLDGKYKDRWNVSVTDPSRTRHVPYPQVNISKDKLSKYKLSKDSPARQKTRAATPIEQHFIDGFKKKHGIEPSKKKPDAINLNKLITKHGAHVVSQKIDDWWNCELPLSFKGRRTCSAFIHWFDAIEHAESPEERAARIRKEAMID